MLPYFREVIKTHFSSYQDFDNFPGQVYFMIIIDTCNTSSAIDIEGAETYFTNISLNDFPGENISDIVTNALRHIKVMCGAYDIYPKLGMTLLLKV